MTVTGHQRVHSTPPEPTSKALVANNGQPTKVERKSENGNYATQRSVPVMTQSQKLGSGILSKTNETVKLNPLKAVQISSEPKQELDIEGKYFLNFVIKCHF